MHRNQRIRGAARRTAWLRWFVCALGLLCVIGCKSRSDLVEAELRTRDRELSQLRHELDRVSVMNQALETEIRMRSGTPLPFPPPGEFVDRPVAMMANSVQRIEIGRGSGGLDEDRFPGDEALQLVIVPRDIEGSALKVPGHLVVKAFEVSAEGLKIPFCKWEIGSAELQKTWRGGVFATGYFVTLPWKTWPNSERLRVVAQFATLPDNRWFEADKDLTIRLMPGGPRGSVPTPVDPIFPAPGSVDAIPSSGPILAPGMGHSLHEPAVRLRMAKPAPPLEDRIRERQSTTAPAEPTPHNKSHIEAPPDMGIPDRSPETVRIEAPPLTAEPNRPLRSTIELLPPQ